MKISELAERSSVTISSIKYYIREGLLPPGDPSAPNQAQYGERHVDDLALIRALREHAGLSIASLRRVLSAVAATHESAPSSSGSERTGHDALTAGVRGVEAARLAERDAPDLDRSDPDYCASLGDLEALMRERGWERTEDDPEVQELLSAMVAVRKVWPYGLPSETWTAYAKLGERAASFEIPDDWNPDRFPLETLRYAIVGTYLFEPVILAFRRLALTERSVQLQQQRKDRGESAGAQAAPPLWLQPKRGTD